MVCSAIIQYDSIETLFLMITGEVLGGIVFPKLGIEPLLLLMLLALVQIHLLPRQKAVLESVHQQFHSLKNLLTHLCGFRVR